jgi:hypothetical protein
MRSDVSRTTCLVLLIVVTLWPARARADVQVTGLLGAAHTQTSTIDLSIPSTQVRLFDVTYRGESFRSPQWYALRGTWTSKAHRWLGIEGEWIHAKVFAEVDSAVRAQGTLRGVPIDATVPLSSVVKRLSMSHGLNFILANVAVRRGFGPADANGAPRVVGIVRAGAGPTLPHAESHIDNLTQEQYERGGLGTQVGGGIELAVWQRITAVGEYKFTWASPEIDVPGGRAKIPSRTHHLAFGISYRF